MSAASTPPIALKSLSIMNFRGIEKLELDLCRPDGEPNNLIVLAGPNGCGKTSVLEAALILVGGESLAVGPHDRRAVKRGADDYEIRAQLRTTRGLLHEEHAPQKRSTSQVTDGAQGVPFWYFSSWRTPKLVGAVSVTVGRPGRKPAKNDPNRLLNVKQQLTDAAAKQNFPGTTQYQQKRYSKLIERINKAWEMFYPGRGDEFLVGLVEEEEQGSGAFDVYYRRSGTPDLPVDNLSAGQLELFLFLSALVLNEDREGIVFIDEPELHLDPQWHGPIMRALRSLQPKAQFIVASHSPVIYDAAMSYERHFLVPDDDPRAEIWQRVHART